ncbi:MAG TPA: hypothetical protein VIK72_15815, partial [Clostridiaceae bacterium]
MNDKEERNSDKEERKDDKPMCQSCPYKHQDNNMMYQQHMQQPMHCPYMMGSMHQLMGYSSGSDDEESDSSNDMGYRHMGGGFDGGYGGGFHDGGYERPHYPHHGYYPYHPFMPFNPFNPFNP